MQTCPHLESLTGRNTMFVLMVSFSLLTCIYIFARSSWVYTFKLYPNLLYTCPFFRLGSMSLFSVKAKAGFVQPQVCIPLTDCWLAACSCSSSAFVFIIIYYFIFIQVWVPSLHLSSRTGIPPDCIPFLRFSAVIPGLLFCALQRYVLRVVKSWRHHTKIIKIRKN